MPPGKGRGRAALFMTVAVTLAIVLPAALVAIAFAGQASDLIQRLGSLADRYRIARPGDIVRLPIVDRIVHWLAEHTPVTVDQVQAWIVNGLRTALEFRLAKMSLLEPARLSPGGRRLAGNRALRAG